MSKVINIREMYNSLATAFGDKFADDKIHCLLPKSKAMKFENGKKQKHYGLIDFKEEDVFCDVGTVRLMSATFGSAAQRDGIAKMLEALPDHSAKKLVPMKAHLQH